MIILSLNLSEFVDGSSSSLGREVRFSETLLFSRDWPENGEERYRVSGSIDELQIARNCATMVTSAGADLRATPLACGPMAQRWLVVWSQASRERAEASINTACQREA